MSDAAAIEEARAARGGLTFDWALRKGRPFWLFFFVLISVFCHAAAFYLFQVVYPPQKRELLRPIEITVLDPRDPLSRHVLNRIDDRAIAFDARATLEIPGEKQPASAVRFHPFFEGYEPALKELPPSRMSPSDLFVPGKLYMPTPAGAVSELMPPAAAVPPISPAVSLQWQGPARQVLKPFVWQPDVLPAREENIEHAVFYMGVDAVGRVVHCLADLSAGTEMDAALYPALQAMEFTARPGAPDTDWVWADVRW